MHQALQALTDELRRLKAAGVRTVAVSDAGLATLRRVIGAHAFKKGEAGDKDSAGREANHGRGVSVPQADTGSIAVVMPKPTPVTAGASETSSLATSTGQTGNPKLPAPPEIRLPGGDKAERWAALLQTVTDDMTCRASLRAGKKVVLGVGSLDAKIMFVGEAPGAEEEIQGEPFVGPAGQLLTKMIQAMGLSRSDVYIGNIMNWRPQTPTVDGREQVGNRPPTQEEMLYCLPYLRAQVEVVNPQLLVALGSTAAQGLLGFGSFKALGDIRGKWHQFADKPLMVTYHPSYILRNQSNRSKRMIWEDLLKVMERVPLPVSDKQRGFFLEK